MKKLFALLAVVLAVVSCQKDADLDVNVGGEQLVNITVALPEATRASSGAGFDLSTLKANDFELRYILEIYVEDDNSGNDEQRIRKELFTTATENVVFPVRLVPERNYRVVAWADIVPADANRTEDGDYDYYYETSEGLDQILINEAKWTAMKEQRDAYTAYQVVNNFTANKGIDLILKRPFAKLRVVSTDIKDIEDLGYELKNGTVEYRVDLNRQFNALYGTASDARAKEHTFNYPTVYASSKDEYETETQRTLFADYIFVDNIAEQDAVQFTMSVYENGGLLKTTTFNTDIALHANTLTTIIGEVLTEGGYVEVKVDGKLDEFERYTVVSSASQLLKVLNSGEEYILGNNIVVTTADLNEFKPIITRGNNETKTTIINLNGYTITVENDDADNAVVLESGNTLIFAGEGSIVNQGTGALVDNSNEDANVVVTGGVTVAEGTTTSKVFTSPEALKHVCENGGEFTFAEDLTTSEILSITADNVVINGNGKTLTSTAGRAINVSGAEDVTIKNLNIVAFGERAINVIQSSQKVTIENVTATAANYTVNVASSAPGAVVDIKNSTLNGLCTVNVASAGANVTVEGSTVNCNDNNTTAGESYAALCLNKAAVGAKIIATNSTINVTEGSDSTKGRNGAEDGEVTINGGVEGVVVTKAVITYPGSDYYYGFETIQAAVDFAKSGDVVSPIRNIELTEPLVIEEGQIATINLNGKTISNPNGYAIENSGALTINGEGNVDGLGNIRSHAGKVTINSGTFTGSSDWNNGTYQHILKAVNTEVVINGGTFDATIQGMTNAMINVSENSTITINGGTFKNVNGVIPQFAPYMFTYEKNGKLIIKDGDFYGGWRFNGETATTDIYGGNFTVSYDGQSFHANSTHVLKVYGGVFDLNNGGKLNPTSHCAEGYKAIQNEDGSWSVVDSTVAMIGETKYATLNDAIAAVKDGDTITLVANEVFTTENRTHNSGTWYDGIYYVGDNSFTIDLGGKTISQDGAVNDYLLNFMNDGAKANTITLKNGTVDAGTAAFCALCTSGTSTQELTINLEDINLINNMSNGSTLKIRGTKTTLNVKAGTKITGKNSYLGIENWNATVNVYDGAEIYMNGTSSYNGCLIGVGGNGIVNVHGGYGKGVSGGLIAMTSGGTINVSGGEWIANTDGTYANSNKSVLIAQSDKQYNTGAGNAIVNVTGGTFKGGYNCYGNAVGDAQINIKGGNFNANPASYVVEDYEAIDNGNGTYSVVVAE